MRNMKTLFVVTLLVGSLAACGGDSSPAAPTTAVVATPTPVPCTQATALQGAVSGLGSFVIVTAPFTAGTAGRLDVVVDWTFAASPIAVYVVRGACSLEQLNARTCDFVLRSEASTTPKPRKLSASNVTAGNYQLIVGNAGSQEEAASALVQVSSATCPSITSARAAGQGAAEAGSVTYSTSKSWR